MGSPRVRSDSQLTAIVSGISLADACRDAFRELKGWIEEEWSLSSDEAPCSWGSGRTAAWARSRTCCTPESARSPARSSRLLTVPAHVLLRTA